MNILYDVSGFLPSSDQTVFFDWISIVYLVILALIIIIGIKKGFLAMLVSFLGTIVALVAAFFLAKPIGNAIASSTGWGQQVSDQIYNWLVGKQELFSYVINKSQAETLLPTYFEQAGVPGALIGLLVSMVVPLVPDVGDKAIGIYMSDGISSLTFIVGSFIVIFIILLIVFAILKHFAKSINKIKIVGGINRLLGGVFGALLAIVIICAASYGMTFLVGIPQANDFVTQQLRLTDPTQWSIGKMIYEQNFVQQLFNTYLA